ncbi:hypothetical protein [Intrasporangium sp. YIM S08009]|uniref:hypothetical protein n=1 Tax=Intrasporangium zincisolvens TaxID=3080018 RepID=UPI002B05EA79|nr:hypothetical protein [Intrasporangium sp. YIM S08009]
MFHERFAAAAQRLLAGDDSVAAAHQLERIVLEDYPGDERLDDLHEALALYAPGQGSPYVDAESLREVIRRALARLTAAEA